MKKLIGIVLTALLTLIVAVPSDAAKKRAASKGSKHRTSAPAIRKGEVHEYGTALTTQDFTLKKGRSTITVEYPIGGSSEIVEAIRQEIGNAIASDYRDEQWIPYSGSLATPDAMMRKALSGLDSYEDLEETVKVSYYNGKVVTINASSYLYAGGAHGMPGDCSMTFLVIDGTKLTQDMLPSWSTLKPYVVAGLEKTFDIPSSRWQDDAGIVSPDELGLPGTDPYITADGLNFIYGPYEIGPYAIGMPVATIPAATAKQLVSGQAARFF